MTDSEYELKRAKARIAERAYYQRNREKRIADSIARKKSNPERTRLENTKWRDANRSKLRLSYKRYYTNNREKRAHQAKLFNERNREKVSAAKRVYYQNNRERVLEYLKVWRRNNKGRIRLLGQQYRKKNWDKILPRKLAYAARRFREDITWRLKCALRLRVNCCLNGKYKQTKKTMDLMGCDIQFFKTFLESQFVNEMSWENYGTEWEIDHVIPISKFDLTKEEQQCRAFHYSNCRPLCKLQNAIKGDRLPGPHQPFLL